MKVLVVGGGNAYRKMFLSLGHELTNDIAEATLLCFTGGEDVSPELYGETKHPTTHSSKGRDEFEEAFYLQALEMNIPMVGICRGSQFLHVMNGGKLWQNVDHHATGAPHKARDKLTGELYSVTSTHHQMMKNDGIGEVVAFASVSFKKGGMNHDGKCYDTIAVANQDMEVKWHEKTKCLCFQPHPEFSWHIEGAESTYLYFKILIERYFR
tara:strand:+ start:1963 stop:2595 length:633 start_codon:yes stop_codon:yes gene_type:complete